MNRRRSLIILCFLLVVSIVQAQDFDNLPKVYPSYSEDFSAYSTFPSICFERAIQDKYGRLWLLPCANVRQQAALHLFQFDGSEFKVMRGALDQLPTASKILGLDQGHTLVGLTAETEPSRLFFYDLQTHQLRFEDIPWQGSPLGALFKDGSVVLMIRQKNTMVIAKWQAGEMEKLTDFQYSSESKTTAFLHIDEHDIWFSHPEKDFDLLRFSFKTNSTSAYQVPKMTAEGESEKSRSQWLKVSSLTVPSQSGKAYFYKYFYRPNGQARRVLFTYNSENETIEAVDWQPPYLGSESRVYTDEEGNTLFLFDLGDKSIQAVLQDSTGQYYDYSSFFSAIRKPSFYDISGINFKEQFIICSNRGAVFSKVANSSGIKHFLPGLAIRAMCELPEQKVLISWQGGGDYLLDLETNTADPFSLSGCPFERQRNQRSFHYDQEGKIISSATKAIFKYDPITQACESFPIGMQITDLEPIDEDRFSFCSGKRLYLVRLSNRQPTLFLNQGEPVKIEGNVNGMYYDQERWLWIASTKGLWKIDVEGQSAQLLGQGTPFPDARIFSMRADDQGRLWLGTALNGVTIYDPDSGELIMIDDEQGIANNTVANLTQDNEGDWWLGTYNGISIVNPKGELIANVGIEDGLIEREHNRFASLKMKDGRLLIGTVNGLNVIEPSILKKRLQPDTSLQIYLTSLEYFDRQERQRKKETYQLHQLETLRLPASQRFLNLSFALSNYIAPEKNQFAYRLEGIDPDWIPLGNQHQLSLNNLPAGNYRLLIKGKDAAGAWSREPIALSIAAGEFFYKSTWFYTLILLLLGLFSVVWIWRLRTSIAQATEQIRSDKAIIESQAEQLKELDKAKSRFFTNISHEFRTPLTVISGMAEQIQGQLKVKQLIKRNSFNLLNLINQILDLRKLETGTVKLQLLQGDVVQYFQYILASYEAMATLKGVQLHFVPKEKELFMDFDQEKLLRVVSNLLSNAIKFTPEGGHVYFILDKRSKEEQEESSQEALYLRVSDTGIGIPEDRQAQIFDRFFQVQNGTKDSYPSNQDLDNKGEKDGYGIGLALTKDLVHLMGGTINLESKPNEGTTFTILLPISREATQVELDAATIEQLHQQETVDEAELDAAGFPFAPSSTGLNLLIVEDNRDVQQYLITLLEQKYTLYLASDGEEGLDMAFEHVPDLIISDVMMPGKDGFELCQLLKTDDRTSHIPIVLLTAKAGIESRLEGLTRGADAYLAKPFNERELLIRLEKLSELRQALQLRYQNFQPSTRTAKPSPPAGFEKEDEFMTKLQRIVEEHLDETEFGPSQLCKAMGMSRSHLHLKLKALTNRSTSIFIRTIRLYKAKELLQQGDLNVTQVAFEVGFNDLSYFSRKFTEEFGINPQQLTQA